MKRVRTNWSHTVLVCGKCSRKLDGGFGPRGKTPLAKALRKYLGLKKSRKGAAGIVEVKCLGICPKGAVTIVDAARPREWMLVPKGADLAELASELRLSRDLGGDGSEPSAASSLPGDQPA